MKNYNILWLLLYVSFFSSCELFIPTPETGVPPIVNTTGVKDVTQYSATCSGVVIPADISDVPSEDRPYGVIYGICWSTKPHPVTTDNRTGGDVKRLIDFNDSVDFTTQIDGLTGGTTYYVRAFAVNVKNVKIDGNRDGFYEVGKIVYGNEYSFTTDAVTPKITDVEGNVYRTIQIGTQLWMLENLRTTKYNDGTDIPTVKGDYGESISLSSPYFFYYYYSDSNQWYNPLNKNTLGLLYNGFAVATGKLAPIGWHVPTIDDWKKLSDYLGGDSVSGGKLKSTKTSTLANHVSFIHLGEWLPPNMGATNVSGFSAIPGGYYDNSKEQIIYDSSNPNTYGFESLGYFGHWWSSTEAMENSALYSISLNYGDATTYFTEELNSQHSKRYGFSIRCVKD